MKKARFFLFMFSVFIIGFGSEKLTHKCKRPTAQIEKKGDKLIVSFRNPDDTGYMDVLIYPAKGWPQNAKTIFYEGPDKNLLDEDFSSIHEPLAVYRYNGKVKIMVKNHSSVEMWDEADYNHWKSLAPVKKSDLEFVEFHR